MEKYIRLSVYQVIRIVLVLFLNLSFVICNLSFAADLPRFYGQEVVVTALRIPMQKDLSPWNTTVIRSSEIQTTLAETLRDIPGCDVKANGGPGAYASARLRGSTSQQVLVLRDGVRINSPLLGLVDFNDQLLFDAERVEVVKAPLSSIYGSDAIGGVINIISKKPKGGEKLFDLSYGAYDTQKFSAVLGKELLFSKSLTSVAYIHSGGFRRNSDYTSQSISQKFDMDDLSIGLNYYNADKGISNVPDTLADPNSASTPGDRQQDQNIYLNLALNNKIGNINQSLKVYNNNLFEKFHQYDFFALSFADSAYRASQTGLDYSQNAGPFLYGLELRADKGESGYSGSHEIGNYALFLQENLASGPVSLVLGTRLDRHSVSGSSMNPRVGASVALDGELTLKASLGTAFKAPTINDLFWNDPVWQMYGNQKLSPEKSQTYEISLDKKFGDIASLNLNYYRTSITDLIMWDWDVNTNITQAKNIGAVETYGFELEYGQSLTHALSSFANITFQEEFDAVDSTPGNIGKYVPYTPKVKYSLGVKVFDNIKLALRYVGDRFADSGNTVKIPEYTLVDLKIKQNFGNYSAGVGIDNLFDQVYYESIGYHPTTYAKMMYPMPGRRIAVSFGGEL